MSYEIRVIPAAERDFEGLPLPAQERIADAIQGLADEPRPPGVIKMKQPPNAWRIRVGNYRVAYYIDDTNEVVEIFAIGDLRDIYRKLRH